MGARRQTREPTRAARLAAAIVGLLLVAAALSVRWPWG
jgi:hypothetical protein